MVRLNYRVLTPFPHLTEEIKKTMGRYFVKSKIQKATVRQTDLHYEGSITVDPVLLEAADIAPYEQVHVLNINNGARIVTYAIEGKRGSGMVCLNGAAARQAEVGDLVIILSYQSLEDAPAKGYAPRVIWVNAKNKVVKVKKGA
jgi:aspartate 1-decarboxylase